VDECKPLIMNSEDGAEGTPRGAAGSSPPAKVGLGLCAPMSFRSLTRPSRVASSMWSPDDQVKHSRVPTLGGGGHGASGEGGSARARVRYGCVGRYLPREHAWVVHQGRRGRVAEHEFGLGAMLDEWQAWRRQTTRRRRTGTCARRMPVTGTRRRTLYNRWAQGHVWHIQKCR
jgi:hypothetical protein